MPQARVLIPSVSAWEWARARGMFVGTATSNKRWMGTMWKRDSDGYYYYPLIREVDGRVVWLAAEKIKGTYNRYHYYFLCDSEEEATLLALGNE